MSRHEGFSRRFAAFSKIGSTGDGGVDRVEGSAANGQARRQIVEWMTASGFETRIDGIGNIFGLLPLAGSTAPLVMTGSHVDSQPRGGCFDGAYGVIAGIEAAAAVRDRLRQSGKPARANLAVVSWMGEEGARFRPLLGSRVYTGARPLGAALAEADGAGVSVQQALASIGFLGQDQAPPHPAAYVELHVECGSRLEAEQRTLGVFDRWWGAHKVDVRFEGKAAHTGPTPMAQRRDALYAAAQIIAAVRGLADAACAGELHTSVGRLEVVPNSPNVVASAATAYVELRSIAPSVIEQNYRRLMALIPVAAAAARVDYTIVRDDLRAPGAFDARLGVLAREAAQGLGEPAIGIDTLPGHDAITLAAICPALMLAVPSRGGLCHHPDEWTAPEHLELGAAWLTSVLERLVLGGVPGVPEG